MTDEQAPPPDEHPPDEHPPDEHPPDEHPAEGHPAGANGRRVAIGAAVVVVVVAVVVTALAVFGGDDGTRAVRDPATEAVSPGGTDAPGAGGAEDTPPVAVDPAAPGGPGGPLTPVADVVPPPPPEPLPVASLEPQHSAGDGPEGTPLEKAVLGYAASARIVPLSGTPTNAMAVPCPEDRLAVSWERPAAGYTLGAFVEPLGPRPGPTTRKVNGVVLCTGSTYAFAGFSAEWDEVVGAWSIEPIPDDF